MRTKNFRKAFAVLVTGAVLTAGGVYGYGRTGTTSGGGGGGSTTAANLYVDTTTGDNTCVRGSYSVYDSTKACSTFSAAYSASVPGDTIAIKGGTYTSQETIPDETSTHAADSTVVTFCVYPSDTVTMSTGDYHTNAIVIPGHDVTVTGNYCGLPTNTGGYSAAAIHLVVSDPTGGISTSDPNASAAAGDGATEQRGVTYSNIHTPTYYTVSGGSTIQYSEVGESVAARCLDAGGQDDLIKVWIPSGSVDETNPTVGARVLYNYIHDDKCNDGKHDDGIQAESKDMLVEGNRFYTCGQLIDISVSNSAVFANFTGNIIRNNFFEESNNPYAGQPADWCDQQSVSSGPAITYEYNINDQQFNGGSHGASSIVRGNIFLVQDTCQGIGSASVCDHNVFPSGGEGTNKKLCTPKLATGSNWSSSTEMQGDFHLSTSDTCASGAGDSGNQPAGDIDQETRGSPSWAGPDKP